MGAPFEVIAGPVEAYVAPLGTAFPLMDVAPAAAWILLGANGSKNIDETGLAIHDAATSNDWRSLGTTMAVKNFLVSEDLRVEFNLGDIRAEMWSIARGGHATTAADVTTVAAGVGTMGHKDLSLVRNLNSINTVALLLRQQQSPYGDGFLTQYEFPKAVCPGDGIDLVYVKGVPIAVHFNFHILFDAGIIVRQQHLVAS
jgi:hypothetical protein